MINEIISGIAKAIYREFGSDYHIYKEDVEQGIKEPCFMVFSADNNQEQFLNDRYFKTNLFTVIYYPSDKSNKLAEINDVNERLLECLEYISIESSNYQLRGKNMNGKEIDDVLHFTINYDLFVIKKKEKEDIMIDELVQRQPKIKR